MKAKRYDIDIDHETMPSGCYVHENDFDALLALAKRLRDAWLNDAAMPVDTCKLYRDSAWLEEREE
jgi:hypothetical protein